jgi:predicted AAA+ superfamily ATPase
VYICTAENLENVIMKRKIYDKLLQWKQEKNGTTAILIEGARRVGKSWIAEEFARNEYESYLLIDFSKAPKRVKDWFEEYLEDIDTLLQNLQLHYKKRLSPRKSLIIFDEVQKCPRAREAIKALVQDHRFDYLETGSLISIKKNVDNIVIPSEEEGLDMFPMDFEEFLWAMGNEVMMPYIKSRWEKLKPMGDFHREALQYFRQYLIVGGMPQAVAEYAVSRDFKRVDAIKRQILRLYTNDIKKYAGGATARVSAIYDAIPGQLQKKEKKFVLSALKDEARMREWDSAFFWLEDAKIANICYNTTAPNIGLRLNEDRTSLKCYFCDTGLLISLAFSARGIVSNEIYQKLMFDKLEVNEGMLVENIVAQMLKASGNDLFFYSNSDREDAESRMQIDFLIQKERVTSRHNISPIEVKSSANYTLSSIHKCVKKYGQYLSTPYVLHTKDVEIEEGLVYLPLYMTSLL